MRDPARVQVLGPLAPYAAGFRSRLAGLGYAANWAAVHLQVLAGLSHWLEHQGLDASGLTPARAEAFIAQRRATGAAAARSLRSLAPLLAYLRELGVAPPPEGRGAATPTDVLLGRYAGWLVGERGLTEATVVRNVALVGPFLERHLRAGVEELAELTSGDVVAFVLSSAATGRSSATVARGNTALRSLLRYLHLHGLTGPGLAEAVPAVACWKQAGLPKFLTTAQQAALLGSCELRTVVGRRDLAVLTVLVRLGLRAGEVAALRLTDIDWRTGEVRVCGKGHRIERLPLPADVGEAIAAYLTDARPVTASGREVFVRVRAPHGALTRGAVTQLVARAARRCGLGVVYAHRLRHSAATGMLAAGASLDEIGQVLRHRHALTTAVYAKVDHQALRALARPWPGSPGGGR